MKYINWLNDFLAKIESGFLIILLLTMVSLAFLQVILRNFFSTAILWADVFLRHLVLWVGFLGAALAIREGKHINIDILSRFLTPFLERICGVVINLFSAVVCFFLMKAAITFIQFEIESGSTLFSDIPTWIFQIIIVIGFGLMVFRFIVQALKYMFEYDAVRTKELKA